MPNRLGTTGTTGTRNEELSTLTRVREFTENGPHTAHTAQTPNNPPTRTNTANQPHGHNRTKEHDNTTDVPTAISRASAGKTAETLPRLAVDVGEAAEMLGVSRDFFDEHVRHELRWTRRGRLKLVSVRELEAWLDRSSSLALERSTG